MKIAVCGGRARLSDAQEQIIWEFMDKAHASYEIDLLIHGGALGVDNCVRYWAEERGILQSMWIPAWNGPDKKAAGPIRNKRMLALLQPTYLIAFPGGPGTASCIRSAEEEEIEVLNVYPNGWPKE